jgi:hypothetical protein
MFGGKEARAMSRIRPLRERLPEETRNGGRQEKDVNLLVALLLAWTVNNAGESRPSGPGVTWDDWVHWAAVSLGVRPAPAPAPVFSPTVTMGSVAY